MEHENYYQIEKAIKFISENYQNKPSLEEIAEFSNFSPFHFQKLFTNWTGISPKKFIEYLTLNSLKNIIHEAKNIQEASELAGLSSQSRVYDLFVNIEAVTPNEFKSKGFNLKIEYGFHFCPFGEVFIATTERGICSIQFFPENNDKSKIITDFSKEWENSIISENNILTSEINKKLFYQKTGNKNFKLFLKGTNFQLKVWEALLKIPEGLLVNYQTIANEIDNPKAVRAVGTAIGSNPIAYLIPCHRVIRKEGKIGDYRWGSERKKIIVASEMTKNN